MLSSDELERFFDEGDYMTRPDDERTEMTVTERVLTSLAELKVGQNGIIEHLKKMNGTQASLLERMSAAELNQKLHPEQCILRERVGSLETEVHDHIISIDVAKRTNRKWWERLTPLIYLVAGAISMLLLKHIDQWLNK